MTDCPIMPIRIFLAKCPWLASTTRMTFQEPYLMYAIPLACCILSLVRATFVLTIGYDFHDIFERFQSHLA